MLVIHRRSGPKLRRTWRSGSLLTACVLATLVPCAIQAQRSVSPAAPPLPVVDGPIAVTAQSRPWAAALAAVEPVDLGRWGFVEEEYFVRGTARTLDWPATGRLDELARGPYATRILIRRPREPKRFSGTVIVEALNPSLRFDAPLIWGSSSRHFLRHGDIWVGVTIKPVAIESLKAFDATRYAGLGFPNPLPADRTCDQARLPMPRGGLPPESSPATENGLIWDALSQVGALLKSDDRSNPLRNFRPERLYMSGDSQSGGFVFNYALAIHPFVQGAAGKPLWDGYVATVATGPGLPLHQCAAPIPQGDPRLTIGPVGVPLIGLVSQSEVRSLRRRPDSDVAPDLFRGYELAGASHIHDGDDAGTPLPADVARVGAGDFLSSAGCTQHGALGNDVPLGYVLNGIFANLERWSTHGVPPPRGEPLMLAADGSVETDRLGNARGGVRTPQLDAPVARYHARMDGPGICELWGWREPLPRSEIESLHGSPVGYVRKVQASVNKLVQDRWLERADGDALVAGAKARAPGLFARVPSP